MPGGSKLKVAGGVPIEPKHHHSDDACRAATWTHTKSEVNEGVLLNAVVV
jgi:hypothetical protein